MTKTKVSFEVHKGKGVLFDTHDEFVDRNQASTSTTVPLLDDGPILEMPLRFDPLFQRKPTKKVSKLKNFFKSCLALIEDKDAME